MSAFDPAAVNKQIDTLLAGVPKDKRGMFVVNADLKEKRVSGALLFKVTDNVGGYVRVSKTAGGGLDADAGARVTFLYGDPGDEFTYAELVEVLKARGYGWVRAHMTAYRLFNGWEVAL